MSTPEFKPMPKIPRLNRDIVITEKVDGTNGCIIVDEVGGVWAASRNRILTPDSDNFGFCAWVTEHADELRNLGTGYHFGEWYGKGIQRGYAVPEKKFVLFDVFSWSHETDDLSKRPPACCGVVPVMYSGPFKEYEILRAVDNLRRYGSVIEPGFLDPEGIVILHTAAKQAFKVTLKNDAKPKGVVAEA